MNLTKEQKHDLDNLIKEFRKLNDTKSVGGNIINVAKIKDQVGQKMRLGKEVELINEQWEKELDRVILSDIETISDDLEALNIEITRDCGYVRIGNIGKAYSMCIRYKLLSEYDKPSGKFKKTSIEKTCDIDHYKIDFINIKDLFAIDKITEVIAELYEKSLR